MRSFRRFAAFNLVAVALLGATFLWCFGDVYEAALLSMKPIGFGLLISLGVVLSLGGSRLAWRLRLEPRHRDSLSASLLLGAAVGVLFPLMTAVTLLVARYVGAWSLLPFFGVASYLYGCALLNRRVKVRAG